jgi:hypothetical protein
VLTVITKQAGTGKRDPDAHLKVPETCGIPITPFPIRAPARCYPGLAVLTKNARTLVPGATYARRESNPHKPGPQPSPSTKLRHERVEPLDRLERSPPGYDAGTLPGELQRHGCPPWIRTTNLPVQSRTLLPS